MADAVFVSEKVKPTMPYLRDKVAPAYVRDPEAPYGHGHGRDPDNPALGKYRYIKSINPQGFIVVPNEEDSPQKSYSQYDWEDLTGEDGVKLGTEKQGEADSGKRRRRVRA